MGVTGGSPSYGTSPSGAGPTAARRVVQCDGAGAAVEAETVARAVAPLAATVETAADPVEVSPCWPRGGWRWRGWGGL